MNRKQKIEYLKKAPQENKQANTVSFFNHDKETGLYYIINEPEKKYTKEEFTNRPGVKIIFHRVE
jgi:hypothetical protein